MVKWVEGVNFMVMDSNQMHGGELAAVQTEVKNNIVHMKLTML